MSTQGLSLVQLNSISVLNDLDLLYIVDYSEPLSNNYKSVNLSRVKDFILDSFSPTPYIFGNGLSENLNVVNFIGGTINLTQPLLFSNNSNIGLLNNFGHLSLNSNRLEFISSDKEIEIGVQDSTNTNFNLISYTNLNQSNSYKLEEDSHIIESGTTSLNKSKKFEFNLVNNSLRLFSNNSNYVGIKSNNPIVSYNLSFPTTNSSLNSLLLFDNLGNSTWLNKDYFITDVFNSVNKLTNSQLAFGDINNKITSNSTIFTNGVDTLNLGNGNNSYTLLVGGASLSNTTSNFTITKTNVNVNSELTNLSGRLQIGNSLSVIDANGQLRLNSGNVELYSSSVVGNWINLNSIAVPNQRVPFGDTNNRQLASNSNFTFDSVGNTLFLTNGNLNFNSGRLITGNTNGFLTFSVGNNLQTMQFRAGNDSRIVLEYPNFTNSSAIQITQTELRIGDTDIATSNISKQVRFPNGISHIGGDIGTWTPDRGALRTNALGTKLEVYLSGVWREVALV